MATAKMVHENTMRRNSVIPAIPIRISDKAILVEEICLPSPRSRDKFGENLFKDDRDDNKKGRTTWLLAALGLPAVGICLLITLFLLAEPYQLPNKMERFKSAQISRRNMFIIDVNRISYPNTAKIANLEAFLTKNPHTELYQITLNKFVDQPRNMTPFINLKKKFSNFHFLYQNIPSYFKGSMFEDSVDPQNLKDLLLKAQLLILWRYGGTVISPDWIPIKTFEKMPLKKDGSVLIGGYNGNIGIIGVSSTCNAKIYDLMVETKSKNGSWYNNMDIFDRVSTQPKAVFRRLDFPTLCNNDTVNDQCILMKKNDWVLKSKVKAKLLARVKNVKVVTEEPAVVTENPVVVTETPQVVAELPEVVTETPEIVLRDKPAILTHRYYIITHS